MTEDLSPKEGEQDDPAQGAPPVDGPVVETALAPTKTPFYQAIHALRYQRQAIIRRQLARRHWRLGLHLRCRPLATAQHAQNSERVYAQYPAAKQGNDDGADADTASAHATTA